MRLGQIQPRGIEHPLNVHLTNGVIDVYSSDVHTRILSIAPGLDAQWDNGWGVDDPDAQEAVFGAVQALCDRVVRVCDQ